MVFQKHSATLPCMMILAANTDLYLNHYLLINGVVFEVPYLIHTHPTGYLITQHLQKILGLMFGFQYIGIVIQKTMEMKNFIVILKIIYTIEIMSSSNKFA